MRSIERASGSRHSTHFAGGRRCDHARRTIPCSTSAVGEAGEEEAGSAFAAILLITAISLVVVGASAGPKLKLGLKKVFSA